MNTLTDARKFKDYEIDISNSFEKASLEALSRVHTNEYIRSVDSLVFTPLYTDHHFKLR